MDATTRFLDEPRRRFVEDAAATGLDVEPAGAVAERSWERLHPEGRADPVGEHGLRLWNFGVKEADLKPAHEAALERVMHFDRSPRHHGGTRGVQRFDTEVVWPG